MSKVWTKEIDLSHQYYLFFWPDYESSGGLKDIHATSNDLKELLSIPFVFDYGSDEGYIFCRVEGAVIFKLRRDEETSDTWIPTYITKV